MGTNYYQIIDCCDKCGRGSEDIHIGKLSGGWPFSIHIIPSEGINSWDDWKKRLLGAVIKDEYGNRVSLDDLDRDVCGQRRYAKEPYVLECYEKYPNHCRPDPVTGDKLSSGDFC